MKKCDFFVSAKKDSAPFLQQQLTGAPAALLIKIREILQVNIEVEGR
jgi:hypothetical protein